MALTDRSLTVRPGSTRKEYPDGQFGLYLVVQPSGTKSWAVRYITGGGARRKVTLGPVLVKRSEAQEGPIPIGAAHTLKEARRAAAAVVGRVAQGADPAGERRAAIAPAPERTVAALFERWKRSIELKRSAKEIRRRFDKHVIPVLAQRRVDGITKADIASLCDGINAPVMANRVFENLRLFFNWCVDRGVIDASPITGMRKPNPDHEIERQRVLADAEIRLIWRAAGKVGQPFGPLVRLLILTGQRRGEVAGMSDAECDGSLWTIPGERTKNGNVHTVPLTNAALAELEAIERVGENGLVFTTNGKTPVSGWSRFKRRLDEEANVADWTLHDLRRTTATGLQRLGVPLQVTEAVLNHISGSRDGIVSIYQRHAYDTEKRDAIQIWNRFVIDVIMDESKYRLFIQLNDRRAFDEAIRSDDNIWRDYLKSMSIPQASEAA